MNHLNLPVSAIGDKKIMETRKQIDEVMGVMRTNIEKMSERNERLENLACRAEMLDISSQEFHRCAVEVRRKQEWKAVLLKSTIIGFVIVSFIASLVIFF